MFHPSRRLGIEFRAYSAWKVVHHKDGNPRNNLPGNLQLMEHAAHSRHHQIRNNSFKGQRHSKAYRRQRAALYTGKGNPRWRDDISTNTIVRLRGLGLNWSEIGRRIGLDRGAVKSRLSKNIAGSL